MVKTAYQIAMNLGEKTPRGGRWVEDKNTGQKIFRSFMILKWVDPVSGYSVVTDSFGERMTIKNWQGMPVLKWSMHGGFEHNGTLDHRGGRYRWVTHFLEVLDKYALPMKQRIEQEHAARKSS